MTLLQQKIAIRLLKKLLAQSENYTTDYDAQKLENATRKFLISIDAIANRRKK